MDWQKLRDVFGNPQESAIKRMREKVAQHSSWDEVKNDIFPEKGVGAPVSAVVAAIIENKHWELLTPLVAEAGDWVSVIDLVYRKGEHKAPPADRPEELEAIYQAVKAAPVNGKKYAETFIETVETWACQHDAEACYDWAYAKPEFVPVPAMGLASLADRPIEESNLAIKVLSNPMEIARAIEAVDWVYRENGYDHDTAVENLEAWRRKFDDNSPNRPSPAPGP
jgi:hypothetical protein